MTKKVVLGALALMLALPAAPAMARRGADDNSMPVAIANVTVTRDQAIATAKSRLDGMVKKAKLERDHGKVTWKVRIFSADGLKRGDFRIDAMTGAVLRERIKTLRGNRRGGSDKERVRTRHAEDGDDHGRRYGGRGSDD